MRSKVFVLSLMMISCAILGEWKIAPFQNDFRFSFGAAAFFFFLIWNRGFHPVLTGVLVGGFIVFFRISLDYLMKPLEFTMGDSLVHHLPSMVFYITFSLLFITFRVHLWNQKPMMLGFMGIILDVLANIIEFSVRSGTFPVYQQIYIFLFIAAFRSYFVVGFITFLNYKQTTKTEETLRNQHEQMVLFISNLYVETAQLKNSLSHIEQITRQGYELYNQLKQMEDKKANHALELVGQIHEVKKNNQRIFAGLQKVIDQTEPMEYMNLQALIEVIVSTNVKYSEFLDKQIQYKVNIQDPDYQVHTFSMLSIINNLVTNAVEAIKGEGCISIHALSCNEQLQIVVSDNGPGIPKHKTEIIFNPGYTSKYEVSGKPSTGIGLSYIKELVGKLGGSIQVSSNTRNQGTVFIVKLPKTDY
jgi:two-component system sensor histidine kinase YcbA